MNEDQIYLSTKSWFRKNGYLVLAGQPPSGSDSIPVVEIKDFSNLYKGSKGSYKPDLIVKKNDSIVIIECKPKFDLGDKKKLLNIINEDKRKEKLYVELNQRKLINKNLQELNYNNFLINIRYCMSFSGNYELLDKISILNILDENDNSKLIQSKNHMYHLLI